RLLVRTHPWFSGFSAAYAVVLFGGGFGRFPVRAATYLVIVILDFVVVAARTGNRPKPTPNRTTA
ncbi:MAG TPA: hypothetical protein VHL54_00685, partial [Actinomycetota bacterium]|nr:hypothetical protein [Actinomycetota bacterium]